MTRRVHIVGDSHTYAIQVALKKGWTPPPGIELTARWLMRAKNNGFVGDVTFEAVLEECAALQPTDVIVSAIGGNKHAMISLIQHPEPYDVLSARRDPDSFEPGAELIPSAVFKSYLDIQLGKTDYPRVMSLREAGVQRTLHLAPPPPKANVDHILSGAESVFAAWGIREKGVSPALLRQSIWDLQFEATRENLEPRGVEVVPPPPGTQEPEGYLLPEYYSTDATHANAAYAARVLDQIIDLIS